MCLKNDHGGSDVAKHAIAGVFLGAAAFASVIVAALVSYEWDHTTESRLVRVTPASPAMMQLLRDEHGLIADMLKAQVANEEGSTASGIDRD
jgi:hypothetical protein